MADITLIGIPSGAETQVKELAAVAVERFLKAKDVKVADEITTKFETDVDKFRDDNGLDKKFSKEEEEAI